jgi:hypothetical protein
MIQPMELQDFPEYEIHCFPGKCYMHFIAQKHSQIWSKFFLQYLDVWKSTICCVVIPCNQEKAHVSEKHATSVFRVKEKGKQETSRSRQQVQHTAAYRELLLVSCLAYYLTLKRKVICSSNTSHIFQRTQYYNLEEHIFYSHCCENPKSNMDASCTAQNLIVQKICQLTNDCG